MLNLKDSGDLGFFFFNDTATTEIYTLSLHDALPILRILLAGPKDPILGRYHSSAAGPAEPRSEEHTSELQSPDHLVCRLLLEKKTNTICMGRIPFLSLPATILIVLFICQVAPSQALF